MRSKMNPRVDKKVFKNTASRTRKVNVFPVRARGGVRL